MGDTPKLSWTERRPSGKKIVRLEVTRGHYSFPEYDGKSELSPWTSPAPEPTEEELHLLGIGRTALAPVVVPYSDVPVDVEFVVEIKGHVTHHGVSTGLPSRLATQGDLRRVGYIPVEGFIMELCELQAQVLVVESRPEGSTDGAEGLLHFAKALLAKLPRPTTSDGI